MADMDLVLEILPNILSRLFIQTNFAVSVMIINFSHILPIFDTVCHFKVQSVTCIVYSNLHCDFNLHFPNN